MVVVGAGIGGLTAAAVLAHRGHAVTIVEATGVVGGKAGRRTVGGVEFDTGPTLLTMPHVIRRGLAACGLDEEALDLRPVEPVTRYRFADGSDVAVSADTARSAEALEAWSPGAGRAWRGYLDRCASMWEGSEAVLEGLPPWPPRRPTADDPAPDLRDGLRVRPHQTLRQFARSASRGDLRLQQVIERFATYAGADPRRAPAVLALSGYVEHAFGAWYPGVDGGIHAIPSALAARAQACGADLLLDEPVTAIVARGGRAVAVQTAARELPADAVVFGGDHRTLAGLLEGGAGGARSLPGVAAARSLLGNAVTWSLPRDAVSLRSRAARAAGRPGRREPSVSGLALLLAVEGARPAEAHHEIRFCADYDAEFDDLFRHPRLVRDPTVYVSRAAATAAAAPASIDRPSSGAIGPLEGRSTAGVEPWFVLVNAPAGAPEDELDAYAAAIESGLDLQGGRVVARGRRSPADLARETGTPDGAIYGDAPHGRLGTLRKPGPLVQGLRHLVRVGGTVHPGGGVPLVMLSGLTAARLVEAGR